MTEHQLECPYQYLEPTDGVVIETPCLDRRCNVWLDLRSWFGFKAEKLDNEEFSDYFRDIAHEGCGLYEKLVVLGGKSLTMMSEIHISEKYDGVGIPIDLQSEIPEEIIRKVWTSKRVERVTSPNALYTFAKAYLSTAQSLPTHQSVVKYIKACVGYAVHSPPALFDKSFNWMPTLIEHIYWVSRLQTETNEEDNEILQDLQEYFGYPYDRIIPRIRECLTQHHLDLQDEATPSGQDILRLYATDYFKAIADHNGISRDRVSCWVEDEVAQFMRSRALELFASCWLHLSPFFALSPSHKELPNGREYAEVCTALIAGCFVLVSDDLASVSMTALVHRLRQIQLLMHLTELDIEKFHCRDPIALHQGVDIYRWSSIADKMQNKFNHWAHSLDPSSNYQPKGISGDHGTPLPASAPPTHLATATQPQPSDTTHKISICESLFPASCFTKKSGISPQKTFPIKMVGEGDGKVVELHPLPSSHNLMTLRKRSTMPPPVKLTPKCDEREGLWRPPLACLMKPVVRKDRYSSKEEDSKFRIRYEAPIHAGAEARRAFNVYRNESDRKSRVEPLLRANLSPMKSIRTGAYEGDIRAKISCAEGDAPIEVDFVREGRSGSPRVYYRSAMPGAAGKGTVEEKRNNRRGGCDDRMSGSSSISPLASSNGSGNSMEDMEDSEVTFMSDGIHNSEYKHFGRRPRNRPSGGPVPIDYSARGPSYQNRNNENANMGRRFRILPQHVCAYTPPPQI